MRLAWKRKVSRKGATARYPREWKIVLKFISAVMRRLAACKERETIRGGSSWKQQARNASNYHSRMEGVLKWSKDGAKMARHESAFRIIVGCRKTAQADLHRPTENPSHNVQAVRARIRARVQRLCDDERGIRGREKIWRQIYFGSHGGCRARLPEPAED